MSYLFKSDKELLKAFGEKFKTARVAVNISQEKLARQTGVSRTTITRLESGENVSLLHTITLLREIGELEGFTKLMDKSHIVDPELAFKQKEKQRKKAKRDGTRSSIKG